MTRRPFTMGILALALLAPMAAAQVAPEGVVDRVSAHMGQMSMVMPVETPEDMAVTEVIRFEPWQMLDELFRDDIVLLMRHGPTDWSQAEVPDAASTSCEAQRAMTPAGRDRMRQLGALLVANELRPGRIVVSEWCRSQETYAALETGMLAADMNVLDGVEVATSADLDPPGSGGGSADAAAMRKTIKEWDGGDGPLLLISHFPNIAALTEFNVYEGEMLIVDPKRGGRVLGYLRLGSAEPDPAHFDASVIRSAATTTAPRDD